MDLGIIETALSLWWGFITLALLYIIYGTIKGLWQNNSINDMKETGNSMTEYLKNKEV